MLPVFQGKHPRYFGDPDGLAAGASSALYGVAELEIALAVMLSMM
jgi:hypothetical protein